MTNCHNNLLMCDHTAVVTGPCAPQRRCLGCAFTLARSIPSSGIPACPWSGRCACLCRAHSAPSALEAHSFDSPARTDPNHSSCASTLAKPGPRPLVRVRGVSAERSVWCLRMQLSRPFVIQLLRPCVPCACASLSLPPNPRSAISPWGHPEWGRAGSNPADGPQPQWLL